MDGADVYQVRPVLVVVVVEIVDVLEVVAVDVTGLGVLVGHDVIRVLLDLECDALLLEQRRGEVVQDLGMRAGACAHHERLGSGGRAGALGGAVTAAGGERGDCGNAGGSGEQLTTGDGDVGVHG